MWRILILPAAMLLTSCFIFGNFSKRSIRYEGEAPVKVIVPRPYLRSEMKTDSAGNQAQFYYYPGGAVLYFAKMKDTSVPYQYIRYDMNLPQDLYHTRYYKGVYEDGRYWRETRFGNYKAGYYDVNEERDGVFDSSINYFSLRSVQ